MIQRHAEFTGSALAIRVLAAWDDTVPRFVRVIPNDYERMLEAFRDVEAEGLSGEEAVMAAFELNKQRSCPRQRELGGFQKGHPWRNQQALWNSDANCPRPCAAGAHQGLEHFTCLSRREAAQQGARCMDCGVPFCHTGLSSTDGVGLPDQQPDSRMERPGLPRLWQQALDRLHEDQQLPRVHRAGLPGPLRGLLHSGHQRAGRDHQDHRARHHRKGLRGRLDRPDAARDAHRQEGGRGRFRPGRAGLRRPAQQGRSLGHRLRARRPHRRAADVRHPEHEARQGCRPAPRRPDGRRGRQVRHQHRSRQELPRRQTAQGLRRRRAVRRRDQAARPAGRGPQAARASTSPWSSCTPTPRTCWTRTRRRQSPDAHLSSSPPTTRMSSSSAAATPAPTASARPCATAAAAWSSSKSSPPARRTRQPDNPWPQWPKVYKLDYGQEEARPLFGDDPRDYTVTTTTNFVGDADGHVKEVHTVRVEWVEGQRPLRAARNSRAPKSLPAQLVLLAMGFLGPEDRCSINSASHGTTAATPRPSTASSPPVCQGVFAAGDMRRGQSLVVWAINEGRGAARECDRYLMGDTTPPRGCEGERARHHGRHHQKGALDLIKC